MSYLPAKRLEPVAPIFAKKGRMAIGADADLVIFDPEKIQDHGTYEQPFQPSTGIHYIFIGGQLVMEKGTVVKNKWVGQHLSNQ